MKSIKFTKMVASGNDFVVIDNLEPRTQNLKLSSLAKKICDRKFGIGADGLLILEKSKVADVRMRIFNADGSEAQMCGNGARCVVYFESQSHRVIKSHVNIETRAGIIKSEIKKDNVKIKLTDPKNVRLDIPIKVNPVRNNAICSGSKGISNGVNSRNLKINFIDTGVPHAVIFVEGLDKIHVDQIGRAVRFHKYFSPRGTNVDFVEVLSNNLIAIRTYERGVEDETLSCGTGSVAAALVFSLKSGAKELINVQTKSGEILKVIFKKFDTNFRDVWLEGKTRIVHKGEYYV